MIRIERGEHIVILLEGNKVGVIEEKGGAIERGFISSHYYGQLIDTRGFKLSIHV